MEEKDLHKLCEEAFGDSLDVEFLRPLTGGAHRRTFLFSKRSELFVLRHYRGNPILCRLEKNLLDLIKDTVPVQELVYANLKIGVSIFRFAPGNPIIDSQCPKTVSYKLGTVLAAVHSFSFESAGLFGSQLNIAREFPSGSEPYYDYVLRCFYEGCPAWKRMGDDLAQQLLRFVQDHRWDFPVAGEKGVLVHSDFKPVNLLWDDGKGVTVLDWEFAHSGDPLMDFATLIRHFDKIPLDLPSLEKGYRDGGKSLPERWIQRARVLDMLNYVQLLNSKLERPKMYKHLIECMMLTMNTYRS